TPEIQREKSGNALARAVFDIGPRGGIAGRVSSHPEAREARLPARVSHSACAIVLARAWGSGGRPEHPRITAAAPEAARLSRWPGCPRLSEAKLERAGHEPARQAANTAHETGWLHARLFITCFL